MAAATAGKERRLFVALFDFVFTEIAFTYTRRLPRLNRFENVFGTSGDRPFAVGRALSQHRYLLAFSGTSARESCYVRLYPFLSPDRGLIQILNPGYSHFIYRETCVFFEVIRETSLSRRSQSHLFDKLNLQEYLCTHVDYFKK